jgi:uncharacterized damage-inducible protein DinB
MTAADLIKYELDSVGYQLTQVFAGIPEAAHNARACGTGMTSREMLEHLCEVYQAMLTESGGGKHEWGSYSIEDKSWPSLMATMERLRGEAVAAALASSDETRLKSAAQYLVLHDAYHVGQMSLVRMESDPSWNPYCIYEG